jgi:hypothetical protein
MKSFRNIVATTVLLAGFTPLASQATVVISTDPTRNMNCSNGSCAPTNKSAVLNVTDLMNMLSAGDVTLETDFFQHGHFKSAGDIDIDAALSWTSSSKLRLDLQGPSVNVYAPIAVLGTGSIQIDGFGFYLAPNTSITFWDLNSTLIIGGTYFVLVGDVPTLAADIAASQGKGAYALANDYDAKNDRFGKAPIPEFSGKLNGLGHTISNLNIKKGHFDCEGLISKNEGDIRDIHLQAVKVSSATQKYVGAVAGCNDGSIYDVSVDGSVTGNGIADVGGIAGANFNANNAGISLSHAAVTVSGGQAGGIVGENDAYVGGVYATGSVTGESNTGGLVGANKGTIEESYATNSVSGNDGTVGGLAGFNSTTILDCYSTGSVDGTGYVGGFVGYDPNETVSDGYWDLDTSGISDPYQGSGFPKNDPSPVGLTTVQLQSRLPAGFNKAAWGLDPNINGGFPYLRAMPPQ